MDGEKSEISTENAVIRSEAENEPGCEAEAMLYCPTCGERLDSFRCKLVCAQCGYFMSCADYY